MRKLAIMLAAAVLSVALAACGGRSDIQNSSYQEAYDKGYQAGYQAGKDEHGGKNDKNDAADGAGSALGDAVGDVGNAIGDAAQDVGNAVGDALGGSDTARTRGSTSTFQRMLNNARVTDTDGFIN